MRKISALFMSLFFCLTGHSQDLESINDLLGKNKFSEAKTAIDQYLLNPKKANDYEAYYLKGRIYNALSRESGVGASDILKLKNEAFEAFKKNQQLDSKDLFMSVETHISYLDLYFGLYELGVNEFNNKSFEGAMNSFKRALDVKDYILSKKYEYTQAKLYPLDTALILNLGASAVQAQKEDEAIVYYRKLADANVAGNDYKEVYEYMVDYYSRKEDAASLAYIMGKAKKFYPESDAWVEIEINAFAKKGDKAQLLKKYEEAIASNPSNFRLHYNYAVELYNSLYGKGASEDRDQNTSDKLTVILEKTIPLEKPGEISATLLISNHLYYKSSDYLTAANLIKSSKADEQKKKTNLFSLAQNNMDQCIIFSENAVKFFEGLSTKTASQKANYKVVLSYLIEIFKAKNNKAKVAEYEKKNAAADR
ncbi:MAG: hypothetical protein FGM46_03795 [Ferruginibacter sp.]|nr:hypothetical protein [Ferruginibacter sp.]